jgi:integral membrane protein
VSGALLRYRAMAYLVGTLLIVLTIGVVLKYLTTNGTAPQSLGEAITMYVGTAHGFLYMIFLVAAADLARRARFPLGFAALVLLLGTVPFLSFVAERLATARVRRTTQGSAAHPAVQ